MGVTGMKRNILAACMLIACMGSSSLLAQPKIDVVGGSKLDLGTMYRGTITERTVILKNTGTALLEVGQVDASCGCTGAMVSETKIDPGKTADLRITFNSKNFTGSVHKTVTINSNAANEPRQVVEFTAKIIDEIAMSAAQLWFKDAEVGKKTTVTLVVTNNGEQPLMFTGSRSNLSGLTVTLPSGSIDPGKTGTISATYVPDKAAPIISNGVYLQTNNTRQPEVYVPVYGNVKEFKFE
jgi:hypothetical protein